MVILHSYVSLPEGTFWAFCLVNNVFTSFLSTSLTSYISSKELGSKEQQIPIRNTHGYSHMLGTNYSHILFYIAYRPQRSSKCLKRYRAVNHPKLAPKMSPRKCDKIWEHPINIMKSDQARDPKALSSCRLSSSTSCLSCKTCSKFLSGRTGPVKKGSRTRKGP